MTIQGTRLADGRFSRAQSPTHLGPPLVPRRALPSALEESDGEEEEERKDQQGRGKRVGGRVVKFLHLVVEGDAGDAGFAGDGASDHQHHAKLTQSVRKAEGEADAHAAAGQGEMDPPKRAPAGGSGSAAGIEEFGRNSAECGLKRLDGKRQGVDHGRDDQAGERKREGGSKQRDPPTSRRMQRGESDQEVEANYGGREHDRQGHEGFQRGGDAEAGGIEPMGERQAEETE